MRSRPVVPSAFHLVAPLLRGSASPSGEEGTTERDQVGGLPSGPFRLARCGAGSGLCGLQRRECRAASGHPWRPWPSSSRAHLRSRGWTHQVMPCLKLHLGELLRRAPCSAAQAECCVILGRSTHFEIEPLEHVEGVRLSEFDAVRSGEEEHVPRMFPDKFDGPLGGPGDRHLL